MEKHLLLGRKLENPEAIQVLQLVRLSEMFHTLPDAGGLNDQDAFVMSAFIRVKQIDAKVQKKEEAKNAAKQSRHPPNRSR